MRVLHVVPDLSRRSGGVPVFVVESCRALADLGIETHVVATDLSAPTSAATHHPAVLEDLATGTELISHRLFSAGRPHRLAYSRALGQYLQKSVGGFDVVHNHALYLWPLRQVAASCRAAGTPYVVSPHGSLDPFLRARHRPRKLAASVLWQRSALRRARALHATTSAERDGMIDIAPAVERFVVPPGIWWSQFQVDGNGSRFRDAHVAGFDGPIVLTHGRISFKKGLDILIRAFALSERARIQARLVVVGDDDEGLKPRLLGLAKELGVSEQVRFTGALHGQARLDALAATDIWALPSHTENFGIAAVEAMASGTATILSTAVNLADTAGPSNAAVVVPPLPEPLAAELTRLLDDGASRIAMAERGRAFAKDYDWSMVAGRLAAMYEATARTP